MSTVSEPCTLGSVRTGGHRPLARRAALAGLLASAGGLALGSPVQRFVARYLGGDVGPDAGWLRSLVPGTDRFRIYSVAGFIPAVEPARWRLAVGGMVERPRSFSLAELGSLGPVDLVADFQCVTGWRVPEVRWRGVPLARLLDAVSPRDGVGGVEFTSADGVYATSLTLEQAGRDDVLLAWELEGDVLSAPHGSPVRLLVGPMYGYKSLKWLSSVEVVPRAGRGYWEERGYDADAWVGRSNGRDDRPT